MDSSTEIKDFYQIKSFQKLVALLSEVALQSPYQSKHAAGLLRGKTTVTSAHNEPRTCYDGTCHRNSGHAEFLACWQARRFMTGKKKIKSVSDDILPTSFLTPERRKFDLIVIRIVSDPECFSGYKLAESRPCNECVKIMRSFNIGRVYYSTKAGLIKCEKVDQMEFLYQTKGYCKMVQATLSS